MSQTYQNFSGQRKRGTGRCILIVLALLGNLNVDTGVVFAADTIASLYEP